MKEELRAMTPELRLSLRTWRRGAKQVLQAVMECSRAVILKAVKAKPETGHPPGCSMCGMFHLTYCKNFNQKYSHKTEHLKNKTNVHIIKS